MSCGALEFDQPEIDTLPAEAECLMEGHPRILTKAQIAAF